MISRRHFVATTALAAFAPKPDPVAEAALRTLAGNVKVTPHFADPVLFEGSTYQGIWQECGPLESLVYARLGIAGAQQIALNSHRTFFAAQKPDGQLPASVKLSATGFAQIQMVVPIAATAWELCQLTRDRAFLAEAYTACSRWDAWLREYRDTRKTGLVEGFCTYDTGHDNSPRWHGIPNACPNSDAKQCPPIASLPRLCPDLSATVYGARIALAAMATELGKPAESTTWRADAESIRLLIIDKLYSPEDAAFYDLDAQNQFVRVRSDLMSRVLGEHVLKLTEPRDKTIFNAVWTRQINNPRAFWAKYPLASIAMDDPTFVRPIPRNSWGGASQALTALRAPRWMDHYGKGRELRYLMLQWCEAIRRFGEFRSSLTRRQVSSRSPILGATHRRLWSTWTSCGDSANEG